jgi:hypothetical protein
MRFDASERPRCTALHCHQTCGRRFREDSAHHHAGTAMRGLSHFAILGRHCLCVARHERGRANADRRHQSRNALQNSFSPSRRDILYRLHPHHCNAKGFATLPSTCASASVPPACPEAGQSANMCKRPPFEARGRTMIRDGSGEGSTLLTLLKNIQQCCYTLCFLCSYFFGCKKIPFGSLWGVRRSRKSHWKQAP